MKRAEAFADAELKRVTESSEGPHTDLAAGDGRALASRERHTAARAVRPQRPRVEEGADEARGVLVDERGAVAELAQSPRAEGEEAAEGIRRRAVQGPARDAHGGARNPLPLALHRRGPRWVEQGEAHAPRAADGAHLRGWNGDEAQCIRSVDRLDYLVARKLPVFFFVSCLS